MDTTERLHFHFLLSCIGEGNGNPLQCSCLENPRDGGAWWAAIYGVAQSRTPLKRLSSSSRLSLLILEGPTLTSEGTHITHLAVCNFFVSIPKYAVLSLTSRPLYMVFPTNVSVHLTHTLHNLNIEGRLYDVQIGISCSHKVFSERPAFPCESICLPRCVCCTSPCLLL